MLRLFMVGGLAAGIWFGIKADRYLLEGRCLAAGGSVDTRGICMGARP